MQFFYRFRRTEALLGKYKELEGAAEEEGGVAVHVANPALFNVQCRTPRQIELANAFCRYLEMARFARATIVLLPLEDECSTMICVTP
jgi:hypothetical protein